MTPSRMPGGAHEYDVIVVGGGLAGSTAAMQLCLGGLDVLLLEAGARLPDDFFKKAARPRLLIETRIRFLLQGGRHRWAAFAPYLHRALWDIYRRSQPEYSTPREAPFDWIRALVLNGRGNFWGRLALRHLDINLHPPEDDELSPQWPLSISSLAPYYEKIEEVMEVAGPGDTPEEHAFLRAARVRPPSKLTNVVKGLLEPHLSHVRVYPMREAQYRRGSLSPMLKVALETGHLSVRQDAIASRVVTTPDGKKAEAVEYVDAHTKTRHFTRGRVIALAASPLESVRVLLASATEKHRDGLGNSSGTLGKYIMDHVHHKVVARWDKLKDVLDPSFGVTTEFAEGFYIPPPYPPSGEKGFHRCYQIEGHVVSNRALLLAACGEMLPRSDNRVILSNNTDRWGLPVLHIDVRWGDNEKKMIAHQRDTLRAVLSLLGVENKSLPVRRSVSRSPVPGSGIHEVGGARMGSSHLDSVTNSYGQLWDVPNVFVCDGAVLPSSGFQNTTLTVTALAARAADHIVMESKQGRL